MTPVGSEDHVRRLEAIRRRLREAEPQALLVTHPPNLRYLTGFTGSTGMLLVGEESSVLIIDGRYAEQAASEVIGCVEVAVVRDGLAGGVVDRARAWGVELVGVESLHLTLESLENLRQKSADAEWLGVGGWLEEERTRKDPEEIAAIGRAARLAEDVLADFLQELRPGVSERELAARLDYRLRRAGSEGLPFETIVTSGPRTALPHARPSERAVEPGEFVLLDFGAVVEGYCSDVTRTVVLGSASPWQVELHGAVRRAQEVALEALGSGVEARAVDRAARGSLEEDGFGDAFLHGTGHGLGLEVHEEPRLHRTSETRLAPGHVVTVEPGAYLMGRGGVRIEDDVALEASGPRRLTTFSRELMEL